MDGVDIADLYEQQYNFDNDESILESFSKIYKNMIQNINLKIIVNLLELDIS